MNEHNQNLSGIQRIGSRDFARYETSIFEGFSFLGTNVTREWSFDMCETRELFVKLREKQMINLPQKSYFDRNVMVNFKPGK